MDKREQKGFKIFKENGVEKRNNFYYVKSQSGTGDYKVNEDFTCNCPDSEFHKTTCKHAFAVRYYLEVERQTLTGITTEKVRLTYGQAWKAYDQAQTNEIKLFDELLKDLVNNIEEPVQTFGRPRLSLKEDVFCSIQKVYSQLSCRRAVSLFGNAKDKQQITHKPHYMITSRLLNKPEITPILQELLTITASPLKEVETTFAVDSSGFRTTQFNAYCNQKYALKREHEFLKAHISIGTKTNVVTAINVTEGHANDNPEFQNLVMKTSKGFEVKEVYADKGYLSHENYQVANTLNANVYIPFKSNTTGKSRRSGSLLWRKMWLYFQFHQEEFLEHYHKRSNVEATFGAIKKKLGETLKSKNKTAQINELLCKFIAYNITVLIQEMFELGVKPDFCNKSNETVTKVN